MQTLLPYLLKTAACLAVFWIFFRVVMSRTTLYRLNRSVLLAGTALAFLLPFCVITRYRAIPVMPEFPQIVSTVSVPATPEPAWSWQAVGAVLFVAGAIATGLHTLWSLGCVARLVTRGRRERLSDGVVLVRTSRAVSPFSWGRYIVLPERFAGADESAILLHEQAHLRLGHTFDLLWMDAVCLLQWFNPAVWLLRRELREVHEYEADAAVLAAGTDARAYQMLLIKEAAGGRWYSVANSFNHSKLKNRITMMLRKKSSRWAGAKALLLLPLMGVALGAFAETAYVFPEDKGKKETSTIYIRGSKSFSDGQQPLILVDGREVKSMDSLAADRIESITVLKDSVSMAVYGEKAADGVILVTLKKTGEPGDGAQVPGLKGKVVTVTRADSAGTNESTTVRVIGHGTRPKDGTVVVNTAGIAKSYRFKVENGSSVESNPVFIVDGVQVSEIESLDPDQIESMSVIKGTNLPGEFADKGYEGVITITTKQAAAVQRAAAKSAREGIEAGRAGIEAAREGLKLARKYMSSDDWKQAQKALDKAQKELESARKETSAQLSEAQKAVGTSLKLSADAGHADKVTIQGTPESSVSVYKGQVTLKGGFPDGMLIRINGREASKEDVERLESGKIKRMEVYKGDEAVKRYGEKGRNGVVEIRARR